MSKRIMRPKSVRLEDRAVPAIFTVVNVNDAGAGSLRQAVLDAAAAAGDDNIVFDAKLAGQTIKLASVIAIDDVYGLAIDGGKAVTVSGDANGDGVPDAQLFSIGEPSRVVASNLILTRSERAVTNRGTLTVLNSDFVGNSGDGSCIDNVAGTLLVSGCGFYDGGLGSFGGGCIRNTSPLPATVTASVISGNFGAAVVNHGLMTITGTTIANNTYASFGAIQNHGTVTISGCAVTQNNGNIVGGIHNMPGAVMAIINSTITGNTSGYVGGGIYNSGVLTVSVTTISDNGGTGITNIAQLSMTDCAIIRNTGDYAGGVWNSFPGVAAITQTTISENVGYKFAGGITNVGTLILKESTVTGNVIAYPGPDYAGGVLTFPGVGSTTLISTIVAGNGSDITGVIDTSFSHYNLIGNADSAGGLVHGQNGNIVGNSGEGVIPINSILGPLDHYGGPTATHALLAGSPAINVGNNDSSAQYDQRGPGFPRRIGSSIDIGAFEYDPAAPVAELLPIPSITNAAKSTFTVTVRYTDDTGIKASSLGTGDISIRTASDQMLTPISSTVDQPGDGTPRLVTYTFNAPGKNWNGFDNGTATVSLNPNQVFDISNRPVIRGVLGVFQVAVPFVVDNAGDADDGNYGPGQLNLREALAFANASADTPDTIVFAPALAGQTVRLASQLVISSPVTIHGDNFGIILSGDGSGDGRGDTRLIHVTPSGHGSISNLTLTQGNAAGSDTATTGIGGAIHNSGTLTLVSCTVAGNTADRGGGIFNQGNLSLLNCTISGNTADGSGGGMHNEGTLTITSSTVVGNVAKSGGGVSANWGSITLTNSVIAGNGTDLVRSGSSISGQFNLIGDAASSGGLAHGQNGNIVGIDGTGTIPLAAIVNPLADNGGPTRTHALVPGSPALDAGTNPTAAAFDQRGPGFPRQFGKAVDIGAFERDPDEPVAVLTPLPDVTAPGGGPTFQLNVTYTDNTAIATASISLGDIALRLPGGKLVTPTSAKVDVPFDGSPRVATYTLAVPGGAWDNLDNGTYTVTFKPGEVVDTSGRPVTGDVLGTFRVNLPGDYVVDNAGDGIDGNSGPGQLTLREAVELANGTPAIADTITFSPAVFSGATTIALTFGELLVTSPLTVQGPGADKLTVGGQNLSRVLNVNPVAVTISGVTLADGKAGPDGRGGAVHNRGTLTVTASVIRDSSATEGGGIFNSAVLNLSGTVVTSNAAQYGGGIHNAGSLAATDSTISFNVADGNSKGGGGLWNEGSATITGGTFQENTAKIFGGGLLNDDDSMLVVSGSQFIGNKASLGGGIYNDAAATIADSTFDANVASSSGGGLYNRETLTITASTISSNHSDSSGGGIYNRYRLNVRNCTVSGNSAAYGGGIVTSAAKAGTRPAGFLDVRNSSIALNKASSGGGVAVSGGSATFSSSIIAGNGTEFLLGSNSTTYTISGSFNLIGNPLSAGKFFDGVNNNIVGIDGGAAWPIDSILAPLADNGGSTRTHALVTGSPAINAGSNTSNTTDDQRGPGFHRTVGGKVDIGAFEVQNPVPAKLVSLKINDGSPQRSNVTSLTLTFNQVVTFANGEPASAFRLMRTGSSQLVGLKASTTGTVVTLTFTGPQTEIGTNSLLDGTYDLTIRAIPFIAEGFDGDGNGVPGDDYMLVGNKANGLFRLFGDADGNGSVDFTDFLAFRSAFGSTGPSPFDYDGDNQVNFTDFLAFRFRFGTDV